MQSRVVITGNGGSGKTWLAERLAASLEAPLHYLDEVVWIGPYGGKERNKREAYAEVERLASGDQWVIEGVYGWLVPAALSPATDFIFLDLPVDECVANLRARGIQGGGSAEAFGKMLEWVAGYPIRTNANSRATHQRLFEQFDGRGKTLSTRAEVAAWLADRLASARWPALPLRAYRS